MMHHENEMLGLDATAQADLVKTGQVQPRELLEAVVHRIEARNPALNAVVTPMYDQAWAFLEDAPPQGLFFGVPFLLKDLGVAYQGVRYTAGSRALRDYVPAYDSALVRRYKDAGFVIVGKTNTPELGKLPTTEPALFGPTRNPWDRTRSPGGSSGGSAVAVAVGMVAAAHANDAGGSIRIPASCCGLFGLKPTRARISLAPAFGDVMSGLTNEHVVTRSVRDSAAILDISHGAEIGDPYAAPVPDRPFRDEVGMDPGTLKIAVSTQTLTGTPLADDCRRALEETVKVCEELGHHVEEAAPRLNGDRLVKAFMTLWAAGTTSSLEGVRSVAGRMLERRDLEPLTWALDDLGKGMSASDYLLAVQYLQRVSRKVGAFFCAYDIWLTPTLGEPPLPLGTLDAKAHNPLYGLERSRRFAPYTALANAVGAPAMSVPLFWSRDGLPIGSHFTASYGNEGLLFRLASQLEQARPWKDRWPEDHDEEGAEP